MLRLTKYLIVLGLLVVPMLPTGLLVSALDPTPEVPVGGKPTAADAGRAKALIKKFDPRSQGAGQLQSLEVPERDLASVLRYALGQLLPASADVELRPGGATVSVTAEVPDNPLGRFINLRLDLSQVPAGIDLDALRIGALQIPRPLARGVGWLARRIVAQDDSVQALLAAVNGYRIMEDRLVVVYQWQPGLLDQVKSKGRALLVDQADRERLLAYAARIATVTRKVPAARKMPLTDMLGPVFAEARTRTGPRGNAAAENRAATVAMMLYAQGVDVARLLGEPANARDRGKARSLTLRGRTDLAQHFLVSAGIAAAGGSRLADAVGLFKELDDSRGGSGFSFTDMAANRAGVRFAETATGPDATRVQKLLATTADESLFMPAVRDLPEFLSEDELERRFGGVATPQYRKVADDIERRIEALPLHRVPR